MQRKPHTPWRTAPALAALILLAPTAMALLEGIQDPEHPPWGLWRVEQLAENVSSATRAVIAVDSTGAPHIVQRVDGHPTHLTRHMGLWEQTQMNDSRGNALGIKVDAQDRIHIFNQHYWLDPEIDRYHNTYVYTVKDGDTWTDTVIDTNIGFIFSGDIALDKDGNPHILYGDSQLEGPALWTYARQDTHGNWIHETITLAETWDPREIDLAVDSQGRLHVAYTSAEYAQRETDGTWTHEHIPGCKWDASIAVDSHDTPHVSCHTPNDGLAHATRSPNGEWTLTIVDSDAREEMIVHGDGFYYYYPAWMVGHESRIAIDSEDEPHISYRVYYNIFNMGDRIITGKLRYATQHDGTWITETVDEDGLANGLQSGIAVDSNNRPQIAYVFGWYHEPEHDYLPRFQLRYAQPVAALTDPASFLG